MKSPKICFIGVSYFLVLFLLLSCASSGSHLIAGSHLIEEGKYDEALYSYWKAKDSDGIKMAVEAGADVNSLIVDTNPNHKMTMLSEAVENRDKTVVEFLLSLGADVTVTDGNGFTPLHTAAFYFVGNYEIAKLLIASGANVNAKDQNNWTPLDVLQYSAQNVGERYASQAKRFAELLSQDGAE